MESASDSTHGRVQCAAPVRARKQSRHVARLSRQNRHVLPDYPPGNLPVFLEFLWPVLRYSVSDAVWLRGDANDGSQDRNRSAGNRGARADMGTETCAKAE